MKGLMTSREVIFYSKIGKNFPSCDVADIFQIEYHIARTKIGKEFYDALVADLVDYTATKEYDPTTNYIAGGTAAYKGIIYRVKADFVGTTNNLPTVVSEWEQAPKFATQCYEDLWCMYLARYIAFCVLVNTIPKVATFIAAEGIVVRNGQGYEAASKDRVHALIGWAQANVDMTWANMVDWIDCHETCFNDFRKWDACGCDARYQDKNRIWVGRGTGTSGSNPYIFS